MDRGKDFLSTAVTTELGAMGVTVKDLPAYSPHLKGTVESLNRAADRMLFAALPGYTAGPAGPRSERRERTTGAVSALSFKDFTKEVLAWTNWWSTPPTSRQPAATTTARLPPNPRRQKNRPGRPAGG
ncbi:hypothetical protein [Streptomyces galilaeus]|uniref:hypothetical protein n=1 Tax=Streptomyces galilaeus TaxID=33899 RepID=UPI0038F6E8E1